MAAGFKGLVAAVRLVGFNLSTRLAGWLMRRIGPFLPEHKVALQSLAQAFPETSPAERKRIAAGVWDNLARAAVEYVHIATLARSLENNPEDGPIEIVGLDIFRSLRDSPRPAIIFAGHLANWELAAVAARRFGQPIVSLFRPPKNRVIADEVLKMRQELIGKMVPSSSTAAIEIAAALQQNRTVGLLIDQRVRSKMTVPFFGRPVPVSPLLGRLAREYDCPVHGARCIRLPGNRFRLEVTPALDLPRDSDGAVDVQGTMTLVNSVLEGWIREHPDQWLWLHDRWKPYV